MTLVRGQRVGLNPKMLKVHTNNRNHFAHNMAVRVECGSCKLHSADQRGSEVQERAASRGAAKLEISYSHRECPTPRCL